MTLNFAKFRVLTNIAPMRLQKLQQFMRKDLARRDPKFYTIIKGQNLYIEDYFLGRMYRRFGSGCVGCVGRRESGRVRLERALRTRSSVRRLTDHLPWLIVLSQKKRGTSALTINSLTW